MKGVVTKSTGSWYQVYAEDGDKVECRLKGKFRMKGIKSTNPVAVGDHVNFEYEEGKLTGVINKIFERKNYIIRKSVNLSKQHKQGQHTTTFAEMYELSFGGFIIDTPGIKGFGVVDFEPKEIADYFPEFFKLKGKCKFHNCLHMNEPNCAIKDAVENEEIAYSRYNSYIQMVEGNAENYRTDIYT